MKKWITVSILLTIGMLSGCSQVAVNSAEVEPTGAVEASVTPMEEPWEDDVQLPSSEEPTPPLETREVFINIDGQLPDTWDGKSDGVPFMVDNLIIPPDLEQTLIDPWDTPYMPPMFDSVVRLTVADMAGDVTFIRDTAYSFLDKDGYYRREPHVQSDPDLDPDTADLYMCKTDKTSMLAVGDIIALEATEAYTYGAVQEIISVEITGKVVHLVTKCAEPTEAYDYGAVEQD